MGVFWRDVQFGLRGLRKAPAFTAIAVLALALGIGANTAIFSIADAFLLKPLPLPDPDHLVVMLEQAPGQTGNDATGTSPANYLDWQQQSRTMEEMTAWMWNSVNLTGSGTPAKLQGYKVQSNFFSIGGAKPFLGRTFLPGEDQPGNDGVVVLSHGLWARRFGADPKIISQTIQLDGRPYTVVGVMPASYRFPIAAELWLPLALDPALWSRRNWPALFVMGRLRQGETPQHARAEITGIESRLGEAYPAYVRGWHVLVMPIRLFSTGNDAHDYAVLLLGAVGFVLLLVCANIANLQFVRGAKRVKEIAIRAALGGSRWRIIRQLLTESVLIALGGAALGFLFARWTVRLFLFNMPADVSRFIAGWDEIHVDGRALGFTVLVAVSAGILAGLFPAMESTRAGLSETLKEGGRSGSSARGRQKLRSLLVVLQISLAVVLLGSAGLLVRGFHRIRDVNQSYRPESLLTMLINLPDSKYRPKPQNAQFFDQLLPRLAAIPGVQGAATTTTVPYAVGHSTYVFSIEGRPNDSQSNGQGAEIESISPNYFRVMGIPLIRGREFTEQDGAGAPPVVAISEGMAKRYWPSEDPIGRRFKMGAATNPKYPWMTITGIVANVAMDPSSPGPGAMFYLPYQQFPRTYASLILRTSGAPESVVPAVQASIASVDAEQTISDVKSLAQVIRESTINIAYVSAMMSALGILALALAAVGVYGVMAFTVAESSHEIGIRMALGALPGNVLRLIIGRGMLLTATGLLIGAPTAFWLARLLGSYIGGIGSADPVSLLEVSAMLAAVAFLACWIPARRAARVDPMVALRYE